MTFTDGWCLDPAPWPYCLPDVSPAPSPGTKEASAPGDIAEFEPFGLYQAVECTTLSRDSAREEAEETLAATQDWLLGQELQTGEQTGNPNLEDATPVAPGATGITAALATVEATIATELKGRLAFIHASPADLVQLVGAQLLVRDGRTWRSPGGHTVVSSTGYTFQDELHATAEVFASVSMVETRTDVDRAINQTVAYAEQLGLAVFPPCFNISVEVT